MVSLTLSRIPSNDWLINSDRMSTLRGLFFCQEVRELCSLFFIFKYFVFVIRVLVVVFFFVYLFIYYLSIFQKKNFALGSIEYKQLLKASIRQIDRTQTGTTSLEQSGPGSNCNKEVLPKSVGSEPYHQIQFSVILWAPFFDRCYHFAEDTISLFWVLPRGRSSRQLSDFYSR